MKKTDICRSKTLSGFLGVCFAAVLVLGSVGCGENKKHVILISIDTLRHDHLGFAGRMIDGQSPSPFLDELARTGTVFSHGVSTSSWTLPGHYSMLTGLPSELHDMVDDRVPPPKHIQTMAEYFRDQGYATGGFYSGPYLDDFFGFGQGFDWYESCMKEQSLYKVIQNRKMDQEESLEVAAKKEMQSHTEITSEAVRKKALAFVRSMKGKPLFMFMHFFDVHNDYIPPRPFNRLFDKDYRGWVNGSGVVRDSRINPQMKPRDKKRLISLYDGEIAWVDHNLKLFFEALDEIDPSIRENTLILVTSDHGEEFFEHGKIGHRANLYGTSLRVPMLFHGKGWVPEARTIDDPVPIYDLFPTLADLAGFDKKPEHSYGKSLVPVMHGEKRNAAPIASELTFIPSGQNEEFHKHFSIQNENYKLIGYQRRAWQGDNPLNFQGDLLEERYELYDLEKDPGEQDDLYKRQPQLAHGLRQLYEKEKQEMMRKYQELHGTDRSRAGNLQAQDMPPEMLEKLEQVGYGAGARDQNN